MEAPDPPVDLDAEDRQELKEILVEVLAHEEALYEKRMHKLVFYGEIYTAQNHGERLTSADFMPYHHGPYSEVLRECLNELVDENRIGRVDEDDKCRYLSNGERGHLSEEKYSLISEILNEAGEMSTDELVQFSKCTWLWRNFQHQEVFDFDEYIDEVVMPPEMRDELKDRQRRPVEDTDLKELLS